MTVDEAIRVAADFRDVSARNRHVAKTIAEAVSPIGKVEWDELRVLDDLTIPGHYHPLDDNLNRIPVHVYHP